MNRARIGFFAALLCLIGASQVQATVFLSEVFMNPPGGSEGAKEFIELMGTPGMKLDGYAIAMLNGGQRTLHPESPFPPNCFDNPAILVCRQEIDEFFALDGLSLGANGVLVLIRGTVANYPVLLTDTAVRVDWDNASTPVWNGFLDTPGGLQNDGSNTIMLVRNRPGSTPANTPVPPALDLRWGKSIFHDEELIYPDPPIPDPANPPDGILIQYGNGNIDNGGDNGQGGNTLDLRGQMTVDISDDLEIVDEISYEQDSGWEYDADDRHVNVGRTTGGLRDGRVHGLGDPYGFNPDCLTRVDYRTKGPGWAPPPFGAGTGELAGGNNWQDTATEQWIRGEVLQCISGCPGAGGAPQFFYDNSAVAAPDPSDPDAIYDPSNPGASYNQLYRTNVPLWLNDGVGADFNFGAASTYQVMAGRVNPLAVPFIPGDADRDGDCDADDIAKIAVVFGDDDWVFSNSHSGAPESNNGDPATQTRPWDVNNTGDNGIEASDLQWALNFQGNTNGRIIGVRYDSTTPSAVGVALNPPAGVSCTVFTTVSVSSGHPLNALSGCDTVTITVRGAVSAGAGVDNGIMQYVHDLQLSTAGVMRVVSVEALGAFTTTNLSLTDPQGVDGDAGVHNVNGYSTSFTQGLAGAADMYRVTLLPVAPGSTNLTISAATMAKFAASTPSGLKIGHTAGNGNPASAAYPAAISFTVVGGGNAGDVNNDSTVNVSDIQPFVNVLIGVDTDAGRVARSDVNCDGVANGRDVAAMVDILVP